jgi:ABC-type Fe3+ transport system substrate-binding protein
VKRSAFATSAAVAMAAAAVAPALARDDRGADANRNALVAAARKEGELNILQATFGDPQLWSSVQTAVNAKYHLDVRLNGRPGPSSASLAPRLVEEVRAGRRPSSDITLNPPIQQMLLDNAQALLRVDWRGFDPSIPPDAVTKSGTGLTVGGSLITAVYNTNVIPHASAPKILDDLRDPRYKGLIATAPYAGAWPPVAVARGLNRVESFLKEIAANGNLKGFVPITDTQSIASGQFGILLFTDSKVRTDRMIAQGAPVATTPLGINAAFTYAINIVKGTPSPNLAKLVGLFFASRDGQKLLSQYTSYDSPYIPGSATYEALQFAHKRNQQIVIETDALVAQNPQIYQDFGKDYARLVGAR